MTRAAIPIAIAVAAVLPAAAPSARQARPSPRDVADAAAAYVAEYQKQLTYLLADEVYRQQLYDASGLPVAERTMTAESFVTFVEQERAWISVRDVATVDGQPVPDRDDLRALLEGGPLSGVARAVAARNARFNLGRITRNFNEPTLGLLVVDRRHRSRFRFEVRGVEAAEAGALVTLAFTERDRPTLVHGTDGRPVYATGTLLVEAGTGRVRQTSMDLKYGSITARLVTDYRRDERLDLWVPAALFERYEETAASRREIVSAEARYTNYRQFRVNVRIK